MSNAMHSSTGIRAPASGAYRDRLATSISVADRRYDLAGISTAVLEAGEGPPIIFLHGQSEFAATWMRVIPHLAKRHHVVAPDLPGHGASDVGAGTLDEERLLAWLDALIDTTCDAPPVLVGHLLGGAIALRYSIARGERIRRLVLVDALGLAPFRPSPRFALAVLAFMAHPTERTRDRLFDRCLLDLDDVRRQLGEDWDAMSDYALERAQSPELKTALKSLMLKLGMPQIAFDDLARISVPMAMIWGRHDLQVPLRVAQQANSRFGWPLYVIERAASDPALEQAKAFLDVFETAIHGAEDRDAVRPSAPGGSTQQKRAISVT